MKHPQLKRMFKMKGRLALLFVVVCAVLGGSSGLSAQKFRLDIPIVKSNRLISISILENLKIVLDLDMNFSIASYRKENGGRYRI